MNAERCRSCAAIRSPVRVPTGAHDRARHQRRGLLQARLVVDLSAVFRSVLAHTGEEGRPAPRRDSPSWRSRNRRWLDIALVEVHIEVGRRPHRQPSVERRNRSVPAPPIEAPRPVIAGTSGSGTNHRSPTAARTGLARSAGPGPTSGRCSSLPPLPGPDVSAARSSRGSADGGRARIFFDRIAHPRRRVVEASNAAARAR